MTHPIPLARPSLGADEEAAALRVLRSGRLVQGPEVAAFEEALSASCGRRWAVAVSSGTAALHLSLWALGVGPGQVVRVPAFTFPATANAVRLVGAELQLVDVNPRTWCMRLPEKLSERERSLTVHQFGFPAKVFPGDISDAACAAGVPQAMEGACACLSFHPRKVITTGEGGAIVGDDDGLRDTLRALRAHGMTPKKAAARFLHLDLTVPGLNYRLSEQAAAIGRVQLAKLSAFLDERRELVARYRRRLDGSGLSFQADTPARSWQTFAVVLPDRPAENESPETGRDHDRETLRGALADRGIETQIASYALHTLTAYRDDPAKFPVADRLHHRALALPLWNGLPPADVDRVADALLQSLPA